VPLTPALLSPPLALCARRAVLYPQHPAAQLGGASSPPGLLAGGGSYLPDPLQGIYTPAPLGSSPRAGPTRGATELRCTICNVTCNSLLTLQQHLASKRHVTRAASQALAPLRAAAAAVAATAPLAAVGAGGGEGGGISRAGSPQPVTYVGPNAAVRDYCKQEISAELNQVGFDLLSLSL
jgi:hypothetical protein